MKIIDLKQPWKWLTTRRSAILATAGFLFYLCSLFSIVIGELKIIQKIEHGKMLALSCKGGRVL